MKKPTLKNVPERLYAIINRTGELVAKSFAGYIATKREDLPETDRRYGEKVVEYVLDRPEEEHRLEDCMKQVAEKYEGLLKDCIPGSGYWKDFDQAVSLKDGSTRSVLPIWFIYQIPRKRGLPAYRKSYFISEFCPFCGKRTRQTEPPKKTLEGSRGHHRVTTGGGK